MINSAVRIYYYFRFGGILFLYMKLKDKIIGSRTSEDFFYHKQLSAKTEEYPGLLSQIYGMKFGKKLNLENPKTFNEKIQWMKLYDSTPLKTKLADKWKVRKWVAGKIGEQYLIPLLGIWDNFSEIDLDSLPDSFVLKANHGSGMNLIIKNKRTTDWKEAKEKMDGWLSYNFAFMAGLELQYRNIMPKIIAEQYIRTKSGNLYDYKIHCFNGKPIYIQLIGNRDLSSHTAKEAFYDTGWNLQPFTYTYPQYKTPKKPPENLNEMLYLAEKLSEGFAYVRVDFYELDDGGLKFGEMTFTPASGMDRWNPKIADRLLGSLIRLPNDSETFGRPNQKGI